MAIFFELQKKKIGFSRVGRLLTKNKDKIRLSTPDIIIPLNKVLMRQLSFIEEFDNHKIFIINDEKYLNTEIIKEKFKTAMFIYSYLGKIEIFEEALVKAQNLFLEDNILSIIPFNIPTTSISKDFAANEIQKYLKTVEKILKKYPDLKFGLKIRIFDYFELFELYLPILKLYSNIKLVDLADVFEKLNKFRQILKIIVQIKSENDNNLILMASGKILTYVYPILIYIGIDLIDTSYLLYISSENFYDTIEYLLPIYKIKYLPCSCISCKSHLRNLLLEKYSSEKIKLLCIHNLITAKNYMNKIKQYLNTEDFRAFIEKSCFSNTNLISLLRILDKNFFDIIRLETPITQKNVILNCYGAISYYRPDFQEFRTRLLNNFEPESFTKLIILFPCSAEKPYSISKSHKRFLNILRKFPEFPTFQEIILTSPLGAIPRQLEDIYPVNCYNIPVTGDWDEEEIRIASHMLLQLISKYEKNIPIIAHVEEKYIEIVNNALKSLDNNCYFSKIYNKVTSKESLGSLENNIRDAIRSLEPFSFHPIETNYLKTWTRKFVKILDYQFGIGTGKRIFSNEMKLQNKKDARHYNIIDAQNNKVIGIFNKSTGQIILSVLGAQLLEPFNTMKNQVIVFNGIKINGNTLFRPGILEYNKDLLPKSNVIIVDQERKRVIGVGEMIVGANFIKNSTNGRIAKIYERVSE